MSGPVGAVIERFGHRVSGRWRGLKSDTWEGGHRVPFIASWPGVVAPGTTSDQLLCLTDLYATFAELHGHALDQGPDGDTAEDSLSMLAVLRGTATAPVRDAIIHHSGDGTFAVRRGAWKLIIGNLGSGGFSKPGRVKPKDSDPGGQLYDLARDPGETTNLWTAHPDIVKALTALLDGYRATGRSR